MNATTYSSSPASHFCQRVKQVLLCGLLSLAFCRAALATDSLYWNDAIVNYPGNVAYPPNIDATNFLNTGTFIINFTTFSLLNQFYETWNTLNYTNSGNMTVNTGFKFDDQTSAGPHMMAGSFYNDGTISCASLTDTNIAFFFGAGQLSVLATNIVNPGLVTAGLDGLIQFSGQNVDLTRCVLDTEGFGAFSSFFNLNLGMFGVYATKGLDTNGDWNPISQLSAVSAAPSSPVSGLGPSPAGFGFPNVPMATTPYFQVAGSVSNIIYRYVFINNTNPAVANTVYFGDAIIGSGAATVEWAGSYVDSMSGQTLTNYLYLNDDYLRGDSTNVVLINGVLDNFTFYESSIPLPPFFLGTPTSPGFITPQPNAVVSNSYAYADVQLSSSTISTNSVPNHSITNLPGRVQISASRDLNLALAQITGLNYMSLTATNQFDGSPGAYIAAPFADINVGVTNGSLTVSNIMLATTPNWGGYLQAWSARWTFTTQVTNTFGGTNTTITVTNDYRVLIVSSQVAPTTPSQVQNLTLNGSKSVVISDTFNILQKASINAQSLTLTTNGVGNGATSPEGELNLNSGNIFWANAMPSLRNLTNNGAIRTANLAQFNATAVVTNVTPSTPAVAATGTLSQLGTANLAKNDTVRIGTNTYTFATRVSSQSQPNQILIAATFDNSMSNLIAAINHGPGAGASYSSTTKTNLQVVAGPLAGHAFTVTARTAGTNGNSIATTTLSAHLTWNGQSNLIGGTAFIPGTVTFVSKPAPYDSFVNSGLLSNQGGAAIWATDFVNSGAIASGVNNFTLQSSTTILTNGSITVGGDISIGTSSLVTSNLLLQAGRSLTLQVTNLLTDTGVTNGNIWTVGSPAGAGGNGLVLTVKPLAGDLLGTTIYSYAPGPNQLINNIWAGQDRGASPNGYTNNAAVGRLILDAFTGSGSLQAAFHYAGAGTNNALYVDYLELHDAATNTALNGDYTALDFSTNASSPSLVIYYAQAVVNGVSVAQKMDHKNGDHLRWVSGYAGYFSSTNLLNPNGSTNTVNAALAQNTSLDSDGDGIGNANDPTPFFLASQINFVLTLTNRPPLSARLQWKTPANATNYVYYSTNLVSPVWLPLTNFNNYYYGANVAGINSNHVNWFASPQPLPGPATNVWLFDSLTNVPHYYRVIVNPWLMYQQ